MCLVLSTKPDPVCAVYNEEEVPEEGKHILSFCQTFFLALNRCSDSESDYSSSDSEKDSDDNCKETGDEAVRQETPTVSQTTTSASDKPPVKKLKKDISVSIDAVAVGSYNVSVRLTDILRCSGV